MTFASNRNWVTVYIVALFGTTLIALPCWNGFLRETLGRWVTIQQIHIGEYMGLGIVVALRQGVSRKRWLHFLSGILLVLMVGFLEELLQGLLPQRYFEWSDVFLNWAGAGLGLLIFGGTSAFGSSTRTSGGLPSGL